MSPLPVEPDDLAEALEFAIGAGYGQFAPRVRAFLKERDVLVRKDYEKIHREANARYAQERKDAGKARGEAMPLYKGTNVQRCMANVFPDRGAPYRCGNKNGLRVTRDRRTQGKDHLNKLMVVCRNHAYAGNEPSAYSGWAGDPNPKMPRVEAEYEEQVP